VDGLILQRWKYRCTCLGLEPVSRSRIWEGLYIFNVNNLVCVERIELICSIYHVSEAFIYMQMQIKVVNNFVGLRLGTTGYLRTTLIRYRGPCPLHACMQKYHTCMHGFIASCIYAQLHKFPSRRLICTIYNCLIGNLCMHMHAKEIYCWDAIRGLII
jgi:hypothetical protein